MHFFENFGDLIMLSLNGTYENGIIHLDRKFKTNNVMRVIVSFPDEEIINDSKRLTTGDFSFKKSREKSKRYTGSISDSVIEDRRGEI